MKVHHKLTLSPLPNLPPQGGKELVRSNFEGKKFILNIANASLNLKGQDWDVNLKAIYKAIDLAADNGNHLLCFGELTLTSADCADNFYYSDNAKIRELLQYVADYAAAKSLIISIGHPWYYANKNVSIETKKHRQNTAEFNREDKPFVVQSILANGKIIAMSAKTAFEKDNYFSRHFTQWSQYEGDNGVVSIIVPEMTYYASKLSDSEVETEKKTQTQTQNNDTCSIKIPEQTIPFGCPVIEVEIQINQELQPIQIVQIIGNEVIKITKSTHESKDLLSSSFATIILNPYSGFPISHEQQMIVDEQKIAQFCHSQILISTSDMGNAGGEYSSNGHRFMAINGKKIINTDFSGYDDISYSFCAVSLIFSERCENFFAPTNKIFTKKSNNFMDARGFVVAKNFSPIINQGIDFTDSNKSLAQIEFELEMRNAAQWLFDYLRKSGLKYLIIAFSGGLKSAYNAAQVRIMIELVIHELGINEFVNKMGLFEVNAMTVNSIAFNDLENTQQINIIMKKILQCIYFSDENTSQEELNEAKLFVESLSGTFQHYDIQLTIDKFKFWYTEKKDEIDTPIKISSKTLDNTKDRIRSIFSAQITNLTLGSVGIATSNLDNLCSNDFVFGGNLHGGQLGLSAQKWRIEQQRDMERLMRGELPDVSPIDFSKILEKEAQKQAALAANSEITSTQMRQIFSLMLFDKPQATGRKNNPIEVFEKCYGTPVFTLKDKDNNEISETIETVFNKIKQCYQNWEKAQIGIHSKPLSPNYNHKGINHDTALRSPNINGFHRQELAQLALYCLFKEEKITEALYKKLLEHVLIDEKLAKALLDESYPFKKIFNSIAAVAVGVNNHSPISQNSTINEQKKFPSHNIGANDNIPLKIAIASCNQTGQDWARNVKNICEAIDKAIEDDADLLALQELGLSGYDCDDTFEYTNNNQIHRLLQIIASYTASRNPNLIISIGHPWKLDPKDNPVDVGTTKPFNVQTLLSGGEIVSMSAKKYLYNYTRGYEKRHFQEWADGIVQINIDGKLIPFGSPVTQATNGNQRMNIFHVICEESWIGSPFSGNSGSEAMFAQDNPLAIKNMQIPITLALNPNGSPPSAGKHEKSRTLAKLGSKHCHAFIHSNFLGTESLAMVGFGTGIIAQDGKIISDAPMLSTQDVSYSSQIVNVKSIQLDSSIELQPDIIIHHDFSDTHTPGKNNQPAPWFLDNTNIALEMELRTEALWLFDYMRKNYIRGFTQALSGGADSAYNAVKLRLMIQIVIQERGLNAFLNELHYSDAKKEIIRSYWPDKYSMDTGCTDMALRGTQKGVENTVDKIMEGILTCAYLATPNNSIETRTAARTLIQGGSYINEIGEKINYHGIGGKYTEYNIQPLIDEFLLLFKNIISLNNPKHELALENIQARIREVAILMITDHERKQGFSNPNLNEAIRGYTTFLGDLHSGHIAPNMHKHKFEQLKQMKLLATIGLKGIPPVMSLYHVLNNKPSAELQPRDPKGKVVQFDEDAMGCTYEENQILAQEMFDVRAINHPERKKNPIEIFESCKKMPLFSQYSIAQLHDKIFISYKAWIMAQHKLRASPPSMTYGDGHYADHKKSMKTPCVNAYQTPELAQLTLYCLAKMAQTKFKKLSKEKAFYALTEYSLDACIQHILIDKKSVSKLSGNLDDLYTKIKQNKTFMATLFSSDNLIEQAKKYVKYSKKTALGV